MADITDRLEELCGRAPEAVHEKSAKDAAVLIPLLQKDGQWHMLFEVRSAGIRQPLEICFPGGRIEECETAEEAAVRETAEELCIAAEQIRVIGGMHRMMRSSGGFITSYLGILSGYEGTFSAQECDHIFTVPLDELLASPCRIYKGRTVSVRPDDFPYDKIPHGKDYPFRSADKSWYFYETAGGVIWGITAEILYRCLEVLGKKD
jgi:8-oxo-dGTP pyrophosphatase MutT (NUDIX family)